MEKVFFSKGFCTLLPRLIYEITMKVKPCFGAPADRKHSLKSLKNFGMEKYYCSNPNNKRSLAGDLV